MTESTTTSTRNPVGRMLNPASIAIIGMSTKPGAFGSAILANLRTNGYAGEIHLVGRSGGEIDGLHVLEDIANLPAGIDVALLALPANALRGAVVQCAQQKIGVAVLYASGFAEFGDDGRAVQTEITQIAAAGGLSLVGPNCIGYTNYVNPLNTVFLPDLPVEKVASDDLPGVAVLTQSGGLMATIAGGLQARGVPVSYRISTGNEAGLTLADYLDYLANDAATGSIALYVEDVRDAPGFLRAASKAREAGKSVVMMHTGRGVKSKKAAASHTGAMAGDYAVITTLAARAGVCVVDSLEELTDVAEILARYPVPPTGPIAVATTSGGFCSIAIDTLEDENMDLAVLAISTVDALKRRLPDYMQVENPLDLGTIGAVDPEIFHDTPATVLADAEVGSLTLALANASPASTLVALEQVTRAAAGQPKPVIFSLLGDEMPVDVTAIDYAAKNRIIIARSPERALRAISAATRYGRSLAVPRVGTRQPLPPSLPQLSVGPQAEWRSKAFLASIGVPVPAGRLVTTLEDAISVAEEIGYPVVAKIQAAVLTHKTEIGGVKLDLWDHEQLATAWQSLSNAVSDVEIDGILIEKMSNRGIELTIGAKRDPRWGPVLLVGLGGVWAEALSDVRVIPPDLPTGEIVHEINQLRSAKILGQFRGSEASDLEAVASVIAALGTLMLERDDIQEIDVNPLLVRPDGVTALDALIICSAAETSNV